MSSGPDLNSILLGSEGNLGIITECVLRIRLLPEFSKYGSIIFPDYDTGVKFMNEIGTKRIWPASIRLVDNI
jgi:alkyldihydroxyacetonephosphate synthase